jgi:hypothetical protein
MVGEVGVVTRLQGVELPILNLRWGASDLRGYELETVLGLLVLAALAARKLRAPR